MKNNPHKETNSDNNINPPDNTIDTLLDENSFHSHSSNSDT